MKPASFAPDFKRINYTDGRYVITYEESNRTVYYPAAPIKGINTTYEMATAVLSFEEISSEDQRIVFVNGTICIYNPNTGNLFYEV